MRGIDVQHQGSHYSCGAQKMKRRFHHGFWQKHCEPAKITKIKKNLEGLISAAYLFQIGPD